MIFKLRLKTLLITFCLLHFSIFIGCGRAILEPSECLESRDIVKAFYSFHIGNEMKPSKKSLDKRKRFLSTSLFQSLSDKNNTDYDYFTQTNDYPMAFRAGSCKKIDESRTEFSVLIFWRTNEKDVQREIKVEAIKKNSAWLVDKVSATK